MSLSLGEAIFWHQASASYGQKAGEKVIEREREASFYGKRFHGKKTASGKKFNQRKRTAAHPMLPLGTHATVTNLENGKAVDVKITDRGP